MAKIHGDIAPRERKRIMNQVKNLILSTSLRLTWLRVRLILNESASALSMMPSHRTCPSLFTVSDVLDVMVCQVQLLSFTSLVMTLIFVRLEKLGIKFVPKVVKDGEFQDTYDRDRQSIREKKQEKLTLK